MKRLACVVLAGCGSGAPGLDRAKAEALFDRVTLDTGGVHGLSGLAADGDGALWTVAERGSALWRITLDGTRATTAKHAIHGLPDGEDLEAIAVLPDGRFLVGTEGRERGVARAFAIEPAGGGYQVIDPPELFRSAELGVDVGANHGAEGACAAGATAAVAIETAGTDARGRWAPIVVIDRATGARVVRRVRLTTERGKLSALDCWRDGGRLRAIAIERHFEVTRVLAFELDGDGEVEPRVAIDLAPVLRGSLNLEGIARLPDGRVVAVVDNQYRTITGPDELVVFRAPLVP